MIAMLLKARRAMSVTGAALLLTAAVTFSRPTTAQAAQCHRNCGSCNNCEPYQYLIWCCDFCIGQDPTCGCTFFTVGC